MTLYLRNEQTVTGGLFPADSESHAREMNLKGYQVLMPVNELVGGLTTNHLVKLRYWYCDIDSKAAKERLEHLLRRSPLLPSKVVETKNGYHLYWAIGDDQSVKLEEYKRIQHRLVEWYRADANCLNASRLLRAPGFLHMKDPTKPFQVKVVWQEDDLAYTWRGIQAAFPLSKWEVKQHEKIIAGYLPSEIKFIPQAGTTAERIGSMNQMELLKRLSGTDLVNGDYFTFHPVGDGRFNTKTNGKPSPWWIDKNGMIGSPSGGGPTVAQFIYWYGRYTYKQIFNKLEDILCR